VDPGEAGGGGEGEALREFDLVLAGKTDDDVGGDGDSGDRLTDPLQEAGVAFRRVGPAHAAQRGGRAALQGEMEMPAEAAVLPALPPEGEEPLVEIPGRDRGQAKARRSAFPQEPVRQIEESLPLPSVGGDLDAGDDDLLVPGGDEGARLGENLGRRPAALASPRLRDHAEGTAHVAAILDLEERTRMAERQGHVGEVQPAVDRLRDCVRESGMDLLQQAVLLRIGDHEVDAEPLRRGLRIDAWLAGVTAGEDRA